MLFDLVFSEMGAWILQALTADEYLFARCPLARKIRSEFRTFALARFFTLMFGFWNMSNPRNVVGPQVRKLRSQQGLTQPMLAARCRRWGWDLSRETLAKIETQLRWVSDFELLCLAKALRVAPDDLWPQKDKIPGLLEDFFTRLSPPLDRA